MDLKETRKKIDDIDSEVMKLLGRRMELALQSARMKEKIEDPEREKEVLEGIKKRAKGLLSDKFAANLYSHIIQESKDLQKKPAKLIGFQGEHGAFSEVASRKYNGNAIPIPYREFEEIFDAVENGQLDLGIVPIENSRAGAVNTVNDLLIEKDLHVVGEINIPIEHCLLVLPETDHRDIKVAYSHPMALAQCKGFLARHKLEPRNFYDTAGAARMLAEDRPDAAAVIASRLCAEIYGLDVLRENIEDQGANSTRFLVIAKKADSKDGNKCSIVFSTAHKAGALFSVLKVFSDAQLNLTKIESRPVRSDPGKFAFLLDFIGSEKDEKVSSVLKQVKDHTDMYKFLGCYKEDM